MSRPTRRTFLALAALLPAASAVRAARPPVTLLDDTYVAGDAYYLINFAWPELDAGMPLLLRREAHNPHDSLAVALHSPSGLKLGYVPRGLNPPIAALLDAGRQLAVTITRTVDHRHPRTGVLGFRQPFYKIDLLD